MLKERPALTGAGKFTTVSVRPQTYATIQKLAKRLHWQVYEVVHALVESEAREQGIVKP